MMKTRKLVRSIVTADVVEAYINQCRVVNLGESNEVQFPPTPDEIDQLIAYLKGQKVNPAVVGGVGVLQHMGSASNFRPTTDVDIWVSKVPSILKGWRQDPEAVGIPSWISPSGGHVDFVTPGQNFGTEVGRVPRKIEVDSGRFPVGSWKTIMWLKLNSHREKDLSDVVTLARKLDIFPSTDDFNFFGKMNKTQLDNLNLVQHWLKLRS